MSKLLLFIFFNSTVFAQTSNDKKNQLIDSLRKAHIDTIITVNEDCYGCIGEFTELKTKNQSLKCTTDNTHYVFWIKKAQYYYTAFNKCYELPIRHSTKFEWLDYFLNNKDTIISIGHSEIGQSIKINNETFPYSMDCNDDVDEKSIITINHYGFSEINIITGDHEYKSGEINEYMFCNSKTKNIPSVKVLNNFYILLEKDKSLIYYDFNKHGIPLIKNWN